MTTEKERTLRARHACRPENWVRAPGQFPDFPAMEIRRAARWSRPLQRYCFAWYDFLAGATAEPPLPSPAAGARHLAIAQREWRKRNGIPEPVPASRQTPDPRFPGLVPAGNRHVPPPRSQAEATRLLTTVMTTRKETNE